MNSEEKLRALERKLIQLKINKLQKELDISYKKTYTSGNIPIVPKYKQERSFKLILHKEAQRPYLYVVLGLILMGLSMMIFPKSPMYLNVIISGMISIAAYVGIGRDR